MNQLFIVGAQRSGSTYLYKLFDNHHQIYMAKPIRPEPKFFLDTKRIEKGKIAYEKQYFSDVPSQTLYCGEKSSSYLESATTAQKIHSFYPKAKILVIIRNPILRAWSNYKFSTQNELETLTFEEALDLEPTRLKDAKYTTSVNPFAYRTRGEYMNYISPYVDIFGKKNVNVTILEELTGNIHKIQDLYLWLGVDSTVKPATSNDIINSSDNTNKCLPDKATMQNLAAGFKDSLSRLEAFLDRPITCWREHWSSF
nr:sulfotransferase [uncultured Pseudodesulfovibrio sp.]